MANNSGVAFSLLFSIYVLRILQNQSNNNNYSISISRTRLLLVLTYRRVAEIQIFEKKTYLVVIKDEAGLKFKIKDSTLYLIGSYAQKLVASY